MLEGELIAGGDGDGRRPGLGALRWTPTRSDSGISEGDIVVVGDRADAQRRVDRARRRAAGHQQRRRAAGDEVLELARERGTAVVVSPLDSYVTARMITLAAPCSALMRGRAADRPRPTT